MPNPMFSALNPGATMPPQMNGMANLVRNVQQFRQMFAGTLDPQAKVQEMLSNGQLSQAQFNAARQMAQQVEYLFRR